jgi:hypothetical protein
VKENAMLPIHPFAVLALGGALAAQMSGNYAVDLTPGPRTFSSIAAAVNAAFVNGISGPVRLQVAPGAWQQSVVIPPIAGASSATPLVITARDGPGTVLLSGAISDVFVFATSAMAPAGGIVFEGLTFQATPGSAIDVPDYLTDVEVRYCQFLGPFGASAILDTGTSSPTALRWRVHHNLFLSDPLPRAPRQLRHPPQQLPA